MANVESKQLVGMSPGLEAVRCAVAQVAPTSATVLILGETGTGKELIAHAVHNRSRRTGPFVPVHCAGLAPGLITSELFGHEAGAFTGAVRPRAGRFERATGGTLFLDEIGELSAEAQALLLRVLQERVVERVGGGEPIPVDVRIVAATNRDLSNEVRAGRFRDDLFYRLNVFPITVPPLRERREDIPDLVRHFIALFAAEHGRPIHAIQSEVLARLVRHNWPGNVRELANVIERAVIVSISAELTIDSQWLPASPATPQEESRTWAAQEKQRILDALKAADGRVYGPGGAAHRLGLKPTTLYGKMRKHGIGRGETEWAGE